MPTPIDRALNNRNFFLGFAGLVTAAAAWSIWGGDMFPAQEQPTGNPEMWTIEELQRWLNARNLMASSKASREELIARVKAHMRNPPN